MSDGTYTCDQCGGTYHKGRSDAEAQGEAAKLYPGHVADDAEMAVVCDDCWNELQTAMKADPGKVFDIEMDEIAKRRS